MPAPKTLLTHVVEGTFRPERHAPLLSSDRLPRQAPPGIDGADWRALLDLADEYRQATRPRERKAVVEEFAAAARELGADRRPRLEPEQDLALRIGLSSREITGCSPEQDRALRLRWHAWRVDHGADYEAGKPDTPEPPSLDRETLTDDEIEDARSAPRSVPPMRRRLGDAARES